ncbi:MAG: hypothetical protein ABIJ92_00405 [Candidatus Aenigmatarchaeota archaeon]
MGLSSLSYSIIFACIVIVAVFAVSSVYENPAGLFRLPGITTPLAHICIPSDELCDGIDNDCDNSVDEGKTCLLRDICGIGECNSQKFQDNLKRSSVDLDRVVVGEREVFWQQRKIGDAIVEKDRIVFHFDKSTGEFVDQRIKWRDDLPDVLPSNLISKQEAESIYGNEVQSSSLYIISPETNVFSKLDPIPENPVWVIYGCENGGKGEGCYNEQGFSNPKISVIDAVTGKYLGEGISPPSYTGFALQGPEEYMNGACELGEWNEWQDSAEDWFNTMGYNTQTAINPEKSEIMTHLQSFDTAVYYHVAHGKWDEFVSNCDQITQTYDIKEWIKDYPKMTFAMMMSCEASCSDGPISISYAFRKGSNKDTATVGPCEMNLEPCKSECWPVSVDWQNDFFHNLNYEYSVGNSINIANAWYPGCEGCMVLSGDSDLKLVPVLERLTCIDNDLGIDYETQGTVSFRNDAGEVATHTDWCSPEKILHEWYCDANNEPQVESYTCPYPDVCNEGKCVDCANDPSINCKICECLGVEDDVCDPFWNTCQSSCNNPSGDCYTHIKNIPLVQDAYMQYSTGSIDYAGSSLMVGTDHRSYLRFIGDVIERSTVTFNIYTDSSTGTPSEVDLLYLCNDYGWWQNHDILQYPEDWEQLWCDLIRFTPEVGGWTSIDITDIFDPYYDVERGHVTAFQLRNAGGSGTYSFGSSESVNDPYLNIWGIPKCTNGIEFGKCSENNYCNNGQNLIKCNPICLFQTTCPTGSVCSNQYTGLCITCNNDGDCNDENICTVGKCINPGLETSYCQQTTNTGAPNDCDSSWDCGRSSNNCWSCGSCSKLDTCIVETHDCVRKEIDCVKGGECPGNLPAPLK